MCVKARLMYHLWKFWRYHLWKFWRSNCYVFLSKYLQQALRHTDILVYHQYAKNLQDIDPISGGSYWDSPFYLPSPWYRGVFFFWGGGVCMCGAVWLDWNFHAFLDLSTKCRHYLSRCIGHVTLPSNLHRKICLIARLYKPNCILNRWWKEIAKATKNWTFSIELCWTTLCHGMSLHSYASTCIYKTGKTLPPRSNNITL
jgi:hypothetical protein